MKRYLHVWTFAVLAATLFLAGCTKEKDIHDEGSVVTFTAAASSWDIALRTRTEYSGKDENGSSINKDSDYERIDWVKGYDRIRVLCQASPDGPCADYAVTGDPTADGEKSIASTITPLEGYGLHWGTGDHYFYALYPAPGMVSNYDFGSDRTVSATNAKIEVAGTNGAKITGVVPASQNVVKVGNEYKANMNYAYMYADKKIASGTTGAVKLSFNPLVTAVEVSLKAIDGDMAAANLTKVELSSSSTSLSGKFEAVLAPGSGGTVTPVITPVTGTTGKTLTVTLPNGGVKLSTTSAVKVTFLALPVDQTNLTLTLYFGTVKRSIALTKDGDPIAVDACKKVYINNVGVPDTIYHFGVTGPETYFDAAGESRENAYSVTSYAAHADGTKTAVKWTVTAYSTNGGSSWSTGKPGWLTGFTASGNGSATATGYTATVSENNNLEEKDWKGPKAIVSGNSSKSNAIDLSMRDIYGTSISQTTANCYIVSEPGWYKFPCVYGNALKNGSDNRSSYYQNSLSDYTDGEGFQHKFLKSFVRHDGNAISAPWITKPTTGTGANKGNGIAVSKAELLWQDWDGLVSNVSYDSDYIYFYVNPSRIWQGNAVIAAELSNSTIVWSWHIWVTEGTSVSESLKTTAVYTDRSFPTKYQSVVDPVYMLNVNLGWYDSQKVAMPRSVKVRAKQDESGKTEEFTIDQMPELAFGGNVFYQWGRKDPFLGFDEYFQEKAQYPAGGSKLFTLGTPEYGQRTIGHAIQHPNMFILSVIYDGKNQRLWSKDQYDNLWNAVGKFDEDIAVVKTVYDPCPVGFKIPNRNVYTRFSDNSGGEWCNGLVRAVGGIGGWHYGYSLECYEGDKKGIFFPATSLRECEDGSVRWSNHAYNWADARHQHSVIEFERCDGSYMEVGEGGGISPINHMGCEAYGFSVRPIKE